MKISTRFGLGIVLSIISCLILTNLAFADSGKLDAIRTAIESKGALWTAGESWVTRLSPEERRMPIVGSSMQFEQPSSPRALCGRLENPG
jgi:hypothetical protein